MRNQGQSDADWIATLEDAVAKVESNSTMPELTRNQIVTAIKAEVARLQGKGPSPADAEALPGARSADPATLANDLRAPATSEDGPGANPSASAAGRGSADHHAAIPSTAAAAGKGSSRRPLSPRRAAPLPAKPKLSLSCISTISGACGVRHDHPRHVLNVRAGKPCPLECASLPPPWPGEGRAGSRGDAQGPFAPFSLPRDLCAGVVSGEVEIGWCATGSIVERQGPSLFALLRFLGETVDPQYEVLEEFEAESRASSRKSVGLHLLRDPDLYRRCREVAVSTRARRCRGISTRWSSLRPRNGRQSCTHTHRDHSPAARHRWLKGSALRS